MVSGIHCHLKSEVIQNMLIQADHKGHMSSCRCKACEELGCCMRETQREVSNYIHFLNVDLETMLIKLIVQTINQPVNQQLNFKTETQNTKILWKSNIHFSYAPAILPLGVYLRLMKAYVHTDL